MDREFLYEPHGVRLEHGGRRAGSAHPTRGAATRPPRPLKPFLTARRSPRGAASPVVAVAERGDEHAQPIADSWMPRRAVRDDEQAVEAQRRVDRTPGEATLSSATSVARGTVRTHQRATSAGSLERGRARESRARTRGGTAARRSRAAPAACGARSGRGRAERRLRDCPRQMAPTSWSDCHRSGSVRVGRAASRTSSERASSPETAIVDRPYRFDDRRPHRDTAVAARPRQDAGARGERGRRANTATSATTREERGCA